MDVSEVALKQVPVNEVHISAKAAPENIPVHLTFKKKIPKHSTGVSKWTSLNLKSAKMNMLAAGDGGKDMQHECAQ
eukprot:1146259-Pelagomonas_calceolata.AAC.3